jgi:pre-rRNA-processing protein TSR1
MIDGDGKKDAATIMNEKLTRRQAQEDMMFPDEMDTPFDEPARQRFARYRALQSFRSSPWHPKENLPADYSRIFQFEDFNGMQRRILNGLKRAESSQNNEILSVAKSVKSARSSVKGSVRAAGDFDMDMDMDANENDNQGDMCMDNGTNDVAMGSDGAAEGSTSRLDATNLASMAVESASSNEKGNDDYIKSGSYVTITLKQVDPTVLELVQSGQLLSFFGLLPHEYRLSVLNFNIQRVDEASQEPLKSKDELIFMTGFRTFTSRPIYSEANLNCDKNKMERFLVPGRYSVASVFGPVTYGPCPLLAFKRNPIGNRLQLVATGTFSNVNPDRIVLKKVVLTGLPIRVRKRFGVVKHMFYDPQDVRWFKPAELTTKHGLRGHIKESVGTHGLMKVHFSGPVKQNDTVVLSLYKRVFPKIPPNGINVR